MNQNNTRKQKHSVTFYNKMDICSGSAAEVYGGHYFESQITTILAGEIKPVLVKIEPKTTLVMSLRTESPITQSFDKATKSDKIIYNNPYDDRFVVVKLPRQGSIIGITVSVYTHTLEENIDMRKNFVCFSFTDVLIILLLLCIILLLFRKRF